MRKFKIVSIFTMVVLMAFVNTACASKGVKTIWQNPHMMQ